MRPIRLTIEGLRSFRAPVTLDFTGRDHLAIVGDTGAGKSSILEAITYALYGQTTFTAQANQELMNDTSMHLRVVLRFRVSGDTWEVARTLRRGGQGKVGPASAQLRRVGADDQAVEQVEQVKPVNERIKALLGLDSEAFLRTVVLPQGRFARLLVEDKPTDRGRILRQVWRTDELEAAGELAGRAREEAEKLRVRLEQAASDHPEDPAAHLARLQEAHEAARRHEAAASEDERAASAAREAVLAADEARQAAAAAIENLRDPESGRAADTLAPLADIDRAIGEQDAALERRQAETAEALSRIPADDGPTGEEAAAALTTLESLGALATAAEEGAAALRAAGAAALDKHAEARRLTATAADAQQRAAGHAAQRAPLDEAAATARERRDTVAQQHARCAERAAEADAARQRLATLAAEEADLARRFESAQQAERAAAREAAGADDHLAAARRSESAAAAAHGLHAGDACPICRRDLPANWEAPDGAGLLDAEQIAKAAHAAAREAVNAVTALDTERKGIRRQAADAEVRLGETDARFQDARRQLARHVELAADAPLPAPEALLAPLDAACTAAADLVAGHDRVARELRDDAARQDTAAGVAREAAAQADALGDQSRRHAAQAVRRLETAIRVIPPPFRPSLDLPADAADLRAVDTRPVAEQMRSARQRARILQARTAERDQLRRTIDEVRESRSALARRRAHEVDAPLEALVGELNAHRDVLVESVRRLGLDLDVPAAVSARDVGTLTSHVRALQARAAEASRAAAVHARDAAGRADAARAALAAIAERLGAGLDGRDLDAVVGHARTRAENARFEERRAGQAARDFAAILEPVQRLRGLLLEVEERALALADLEDALKPGAFLKWLTLRRSHRLLVHASRMLGEMTGGKYAFVDPGEAEEQWRVLDQDSGQARSPASLSGGEQFIASLSLALGMVEMMARSGGRLESLFLDEGFGSLDRNNLDAAVQALGTVAAGGRMVGVISHVRAVAEQIEHVLAVTRGATGSRAEWLTNRQRERLSESDTGMEAASALAGLLE